jgi:hypothetical protein
MTTKTINIEELNKLSQLVLNNAQHQVPVPVPVQVEPQQLSQPTPVIPVPVQNDILSKSEFYKLGGFNVPPQTLYLFLALCLIGFLISKSGKSKK